MAGDAGIGRFSTSDGVAKVIADVRAMRNLAVARHRGLPVILFGHSMGGLIALNAAESHPQDFQALSVWNSNFNPGPAGRFAQAVLAVEKMLKGSDVPSAILPKATFGAWGDRSRPPHRLRLALARSCRSRCYIADPLCGFDASVSLWQDLFRLTFAGASPERLALLPKALPVYLIGGGQDPATNGGREIRWLGRRLMDAGMMQVTTMIYDEMRHETLNEIGRERAIADFLAWLDRLDT